MADDITIFEALFRTELLALEEVEDCIGAKLFNSIAPPKTAKPYAVFKIIPLDDKTGQARTPIMTRVLADLKFITGFPVPETIADAVEAAKEHFRGSQTFDADGCRISIRHERPISYTEPGATADERLLNRGGTFRGWISKT